MKKIGRNNGKLGVLKNLSKETASKYLGFTFGVKPAVGDIRSIINAHKRIEKRIAYLNSNAGSWVPIRVLRIFPSEISDPSFPTPPFLRTFRRVVKESYRVATITCKAKLRRSFDEQDLWQAYRDYFGLNQILQLAWELVPFSFVIDWFTNFQERIDSVLRPFDAKPVYTHIKDMCCTIRDVHTEEILVSPGFYHPSFSAYSTLTDWTPIATRSVKTYNRSIRVPDTSGVVDLSSLGTFHAVTGGALVIQRLR
jgi:hypothetical protein